MGGEEDSLFLQQGASRHVDFCAINNHAVDLAGPDLLHAPGPDFDSVVGVLDVALSVHSKEEARALGRSCQYIH